MRLSFLSLFVLVMTGAASFSGASLQMAAQAQLEPEVTVVSEQAWAEIGRLGEQFATLYEQSRYTEAIPVAREWIAKIESNLGTYSSIHALSLNAIYKLQTNAGDLTAARETLSKIIDIEETIYGSDYLGLEEKQAELVTLHWQQGLYGEALPLLEKVISVPGADFSVNSFGAPAGSDSLAELSEQERNAVDQLSLQERTALIFRAVLDENRLKLSDSLLALEDIFITSSLTDEANTSDVSKIALSFIFRYKGFFLDKTANVSQQLWQQPATDNAQLREELSALRGVLEDLARTDTSDIPLQQYVAELSKIENRAAEIDQRLSADNAAVIAFDPISIQSVQAKIPSNAALVEIVRYQPTKADAVATSTEDRYAAYLVTAQGDVQAVDLGVAETLDQLALEFQQALRTRSNSAKSVGNRVYQQLMEPVLSKLSGKTHLIISPDSQLNKIPFEALVGNDTRYLLEQYQISYVSSGRDLLNLEASVVSQQPPVIFADPDYDSKINSSGSVNSLYSISDRLPNFAPLPGTATEADAIASLLPDAVVFTGAEATESQLTQQASPSILHLATHGFFLNNAIASRFDGSNTRGASLDVISSETPGLVDVAQNINPLLNAGIALSGINNKSDNAEDGVLTAIEAFGMNLQGTQLVVLSACETGVGAVSDGEGVYGLRRAFAVAGAQSQLMSLWQVDDAGTSELMQVYYENLIEEKQGRGEALRNAQLEMMNTGTYAHPYYWSSFIFSGDWRPLAE